MSDVPQTPAASRRLPLLFLVFASGAAVMAAEMGLQRAMAPYFGASTYVWMNLIGVILGALALGYWLGGTLADRFGTLPPLVKLIAGGAALLAVVPFLVKPLALWLLPAPGAPLEGLSRALILGSFAAALALVAPPIVLLGAVGPYATRLLAGTGVPVGRASGHVLALSTVGSLLGTFLPPLLLIPWIGSRLTVVLAAALLLLSAGVAAWPGTRGAAKGGAAGAALALVAWLVQGEIPLRGGPDLLAERESGYQYVRARLEREGSGNAVVETVSLTLNEGEGDFHSRIVRGRSLTGVYYDWIAALPALAVPPDPARRPRLRVAILGLAGGSHSRVLHRFCGGLYDLVVDGVEIDPVVVEVAREHLEMTETVHPHLRVHVADARPWLASARGPYDLVILDAFTQQLYVPFYLATEEFFGLVRESLAPGGVFATNVYPARPDAALPRALGATLRRVFGESVWSAKLPYTPNAMLLARNDARLDRRALLQVAEAARAAAPGPADRGEAEQLLRCSRQLAYGLEPVAPVPHGPHGPHGTDDAEVLTDDRAPVEVLTDRDLATSRRLLIERAR